MTLPTHDDQTVDVIPVDLDLDVPHPDAALLAQIEPGDIVFFKPITDHPRGWSNFATLADFTQSFPYRGRRPWWHVAICVDRTRDIQLNPNIPILPDDPGAPIVVGFTLTDTENAPQDAKIGRFDLTALGHDVRLDVLRPGPGPKAALVEAANASAGTEYNASDGTEYNVEGLLAFAMAMQARMMPDSTDRDEVYKRALGYAAAAKEKHPGKETCVTAVTKVIEQVVPGIVYPEPPKPDWGPLLLDDELRGYIFTVHALLKRLQGGQVAQDADPIVVGGAPDGWAPPYRIVNYDGDWLTDRSVDLTVPVPGFGIRAVGFDEDLRYPGVDGGGPLGPGIETGAFIEILDWVSGGSDADPDDIDAKGQEQFEQHPMPQHDSAVISPAMLYHGLFAAGFTPVTPLDLTAGPPAQNPRAILLPDLNRGANTSFTLDGD